MEQLLYERPREKLRFKGAASLSLTELLQIIIGSGTPQHPVGKIARELSRTIEATNGIPGYNELFAVNGMGHAKVSLLLATLELGRRLKNLEKTRQSELKEKFATSELKKAKKQHLIYETYDGSGMRIGRHKIPDIRNKYEVYVRRICADLIADKAASVSMAFGCFDQKLSPNNEELQFIQILTENFKILQVRINAIYLVNAKQEVNINGSYYGF